MENESRERGGETSNDEQGTELFEDSDAGAIEERRNDTPPESRGIFRQPWFLLSFIFFVAATVLFLLAHTDAAFVTAALAISAWFWNMRVRLKRQYGIRKQNRER